MCWRMAAPAGKQPKVMVVEEAEGVSLRYPAWQNQQASMNNKELFQDHTSLRETLASSMGPTGCI